MATIFVLLLSSCFLLQINSARAHEGFTRTETLADGYSLEWTVDFVINEIVFSIRARTLGYVGFGLNPSKGAMDGADMIIGGVSDNGTAYFTDGHGVGHRFVEDKSQDWTLLDANEANGWTTLKFKRMLRPCDQEDVPITEGTLSVIFCYGQTDQAVHHEDNRGAHTLQLLNPSSRLGEDTSGFETVNLSVKMELPDDSTVYWESVHCFPTFKSKVHVVGFEPILSTPEALKHVHHMIGSRCTTPEDPAHAAYLQALSNTTGGLQTDPSLQIASVYCNQLVFGWSFGNYPVFFPEDIGVPFGRADSQECFRLEIHVSNVENVKGLEINSGMTLYYTKELRKYDGGALSVGNLAAPHLIVPPGMKDFVHVGHCSSECTSTTWPEGGIKVFGVAPHTHQHGRKIKVRHFRGSTELPWLANDDHFDFNFQQYIPFREHVQLLPGDHLITECTYETAEATHQGESTLQEMCVAFLSVYPAVRYLSCGSAFWPPEQVLHPLGIGSLNTSDPIDPIVTSPPEMNGMTLLDALNHKVTWTDDKINNLQDQMRWKKQMSICLSDKTAHAVPDVSYPNNIRAYEPKFTCQKSSSGAATALMVGSVLPMTISVAVILGRRISWF